MIAVSDNGITPTHRVALLAALWATLLMPSTPAAQTIYRIVGADGTVSFSDRLPNPADKASVLRHGDWPTPTDQVALPLALRQVVVRYPVVLYSSDNCPPCDAGRSLLMTRGIPFSEKTVSTTDDADALQRLSKSRLLPLLTIGDQHIKGFSETEWTQYLDAADYPKNSVLPARYRQASATPLVQLQKPGTALRPQETPEVRPAPTLTNPDNPAGIRF